MRLVKKIIALFVIAFIVIRVVVFNTLTASAAFAAPAVGDSIEVLIEIILSAFGHSDTDSLSYSEKEKLMVNDFGLSYDENGNITGSKDKVKDMLSALTDPVGWLQLKGMAYLADPSNIAKSLASAAKYISSGTRDWMREKLNERESAVSVLEGNVDMLGYGALLMVKCNPYIDYYYCDYLEINPDVDIGTRVIDGHECFIYRYWNSDGSITDEWYTTLPQVFGFKWVPRYYTLSYYGDVRSTNGEQVPVESSEADDSTVVGEKADGTEVTLGDVLSGAVSVDDVEPKVDAFNLPGLVDLINDLLDQAENAKDVSDSITSSKELEDQTEEEVKEKLEDSTIEIEGVDIQNLMLPTSVIHVFPFCLPWDFVQGMYLFRANSQVPKFDFDIEVPSFLGVPAQHWTWTIDFKDFEELAVITRWGSMVMFIYALILLTGKIVKGGGA